MFKTIARWLMPALLAVTLAPAAALSADAPDGAANKEDLAPFVVLDRKSTHKKGQVNVTVYFDFYCSHCHEFDNKVWPVLVKEHGDTLHVTWVGMPIVDPAASPVTVLAFYLADAQGKGEEMRNALFSAIWNHRLDPSKPDVLLGIATQLGLDLNRFKREFNENVMVERMEDGIKQARAIGARGTPTVLLDNHIRVTGYGIKNVEAAIAEALKADG
ncbi:MAG: DsbA family protein [Nitrospirota bacterium]|nr:DsbA family protein [Nitrospirota bacterium]